MTIETIKTEVGSYFISNYPPFSQWSADALPEIEAALDSGKIVTASDRGIRYSDGAKG